MAEPLITMTRAAKETGIPLQTMYRLVHARRLPSVVFAGIRRVRLSEILAAMEEVTIAA
jgi:excisionase family DNA binding protein